MHQRSIRDSWLSCCERSLSSCSDNTVHAPVKPRSSCVHCSSLPADPSSPVGESALPPVSNPLRLKQVNNAQQLIQRLSEVDGTSLVFTWRCNEVFASLGGPRYYQCVARSRMFITDPYDTVIMPSLTGLIGPSPLSLSLSRLVS